MTNWILDYTVSYHLFRRLYSTEVISKILTSFTFLDPVQHVVTVYIPVTLVATHFVTDVAVTTIIIIKTLFPVPLQFKLQKSWKFPVSKVNQNKLTIFSVPKLYKSKILKFHVIKF